MANAGLLPRYLLPRLSWSAALAHPQTLRPLSTLSSSYTYPLKPEESRSNYFLTRTRPLDTLRIPRTLQNPSLHRAFHATARQCRDHHFDTLKFVQRLQEEGFSEKQAVAMMRVLSDVIEERSSHSPLPPSKLLTVYAASKT
jgi:Protein of unknown function (DUF1640)